MQLTTAMPDTDAASQTTLSNNNPQHSEPNHSHSTHKPITKQVEDLQKKYEALSNRVEDLNSVVNVIKDQNESILKKLDEGSQPVRTCGTHLAYPCYPPSSNPNHAYPPPLDMRGYPPYSQYPAPIHSAPAHLDPNYRGPINLEYQPPLAFRPQPGDERPQGLIIAPDVCKLPGNLYR